MSGNALNNAIKLSKYVENRGELVTAPTTRLDGTALQNGDTYYDPTLGMRVYTTSGWTSLGAGGSLSYDTFRFVATAGQTTITGADADGKTLEYDDLAVEVYVNGVRLSPTDYTAISGTSIVLGTGATLNDEINIVAFTVFRIAEVQSDVVLYEGSQTARDIFDEAKPMQSYTALRAYTGRATGVRITTAGIAGIFQRDDVDISSADDGGMVIVDGSGRRWKRGFDGNVAAGWFGASPTATASVNTVAIQAAIDYVHAAGYGEVKIQSGDHQIMGSTLSETFWNFGSSVSSSLTCLVMRDGVYLSGYGKGVTRLICNDPTKTIIVIAKGSNSSISGMSLINTYVAGGPGAGHGILQLGIADTRDFECNNLRIHDVHVERVGSYGIGIENGNLSDIVISGVSTYYTGADGIDFKNRGSLEASYGIFFSDLIIDTFGLRLDGQTGLDIRGIACVNNVQIYNAGRSGVIQSGIRFRTASNPDPSQQWGARSSLTNFYVKGADSALTGAYGIVGGSSFVTISNGVIEDCSYGVSIGGNVDAAANNVNCANVTVKNSETRAFVEASTSERISYSNCSAIDSAIGFRVEGVSTSLIGCNALTCVTPLSVSAGALPTMMQIGGMMYGDYLRTSYVTAGRVSLEAVGSSTDIDIRIVPKGAGLIRYGTHTSNADAPVSGYITIRDDAGNSRKLAVIT